MIEQKILLLGRMGQVGAELEKRLAPHFSMVALDRNSSNFCGDLSELDGIYKTIQLVKPTCIINAAAFTAVDAAEQHKKLATRINAEAVQVLAKGAKDLNALFVHYSTDYVFDGSGEQYRDEDAVPSPINVYGKSKLAGEEYILTSGCRHFIFRTSWVYSISGKNFIKTILKLAREKEQLSVVSDQIGAPTSASLIAEVTRKCVEMNLTDHEKSGIYNLTSLGETNWLEYARLIVSVAKNLGVSMKLSPDAITGISSEEYKAAAARPLNSRLSTSKLERNFSIKLPVWNDDVTDTVTNLLSSPGEV